MAFERIRTIKGRQYRYREERWREGGKVRSKSTYLGRVETPAKNKVAQFMDDNFKPEPGVYLGEKMQTESEALNKNAPAESEGER